jgi:Contractile injection system tube protein/LysM domain
MASVGPEKLQKLTIVPLGGRAEPITALFNPKEYTIEQSNSYAEIGIIGIEAPILQFIRGNVEKLSFDLLIDTTGHDPGDPKRDARPTADKILALARIDGERHAPPVCRFEWGGEVLEGVFESVRRQFVLFDPSGAPTRIQMSLGIKRYRALRDQLGKTNKSSPDHTRTVVSAEGDTLPAIAFRAYGDDALWRPIAVANDIDDPSKLEPGLVLQVPRLEGRP